MAFMPVDIDDDFNQIQLETEVSGAISKSALDFEVNPNRSFFQAVELMGKVAQFIAVRSGNALDGTGMAFEVEFGIKIDGNGVPMICKTRDECQFLTRLTYRD